MAKQKLIQAAAPDELHDRVERGRRSPRFAKIPTLSAFVRLLIEKGLDRLEQEDAQRPVEAHP